jgi:hypothetical protein
MVLDRPGKIGLGTKRSIKSLLIAVLIGITLRYSQILFGKMITGRVSSEIFPIADLAGII